MPDYEKRLIKLLKDYGYEVQGDRIISKGVNGHTSDRIVGKCRSILDACEQLIPIIHEDGFRDRCQKIMTPKA